MYLQFWAEDIFSAVGRRHQYMEFCHILNLHMCRAHSICVLKEAELNRARGSPGKQGLLLLLLLRYIRQDGNCISWGTASLPSHQQLSHQTIPFLNGSDSS